MLIADCRRNDSDDLPGTLILFGLSLPVYAFLKFLPPDPIGAEI